MAAWHSGRLILALANHFNWFQNNMFTEYEIDGGIADLVFVTRAGYLTEIEIKTSLSDWNVDRKKSKFRRERPHISRFFYAIPETLEQQIPDWIPEECGIIVVRAVDERYGRADRVYELRAAVRRKAKKLSDVRLQQIYRNAYFRFWTSEIRRLHVATASVREGLS